MRDGKKLRTYCYLPAETGVFPVILQRGCYAEMECVNKPTGKELARRGFAYVHQNCRGIGGSEGEWEPHVNERKDGLDCVNWLISMPWCGNIGFMGSSYLAMTGWAIADIVPSQVKSMYLSNYGVDSFLSVYKDGLIRHDIATAWAMDNAGFPIDADYLTSCQYRPQLEVDEALWGGKVEWYRTWLLNSDRNSAYWREGFRFSSLTAGLITIWPVPPSHMSICLTSHVPIAPFSLEAGTIRCSHAWKTGHLHTIG